MSSGLSYTGSTPALGAGRLGSIPSSPTNQDISNFQGKELARSPRRSLSRTAMRERVSLRKKPCISELNRKGGQIQIQFFGKANGGSFQFFPPMILFRKNHWTKQVFRRGERFLSNLAKVQSNCFPFARVFPVITGAPHHLRHHCYSR